MKKTAGHIVRILSSCVLLCSFVFIMAAAGFAYAAGPVTVSESDISLLENCTAEFDGDKLTVMDTDDNNDVWNSKVMLDAGMELVPGEQYKLSYSLAGENGVGEFFLCKSGNIDDRYDETFTSEEGNRSITFTAAGNRVYIGMQVGNLGKGNSVTATLSDLCKLSESECPALLRTENCDVSAADGVISATDTGDNNDVWNSKILYDSGIVLEIGKTYKLDFSLEGDNGVGEFFVCRSQDLNDRYDSTFANMPGSGSVTFTAEGDRLYIGMQLGNLGKGNSVTARIADVSEAGAPPKTAKKSGSSAGGPKAVNCSYTVNGNAVTVTDEGSNGDVWNSSLIYDAGVELEVGKQYEIRFTLSGDTGAVGELFLCKSMDIDSERYDGTFTDAPGEKAVVFTAEDTRVYIGMQVGNLGEGNSVTATVVEVKEYDEAAQKEAGIKLAQNCTYTVSTASKRTQIKAVDTGKNDKDVWNSRILYYLGEIMETGRRYAANFNLAGDNGVGEFFFLKTNNIDGARYSYDDQPGDHTAAFVAEDTKLYAGMQSGNIGEGNEVTLTISDIFRVPKQMSVSHCLESFTQQDSVTIKNDISGQNIWDSNAVYDTGIVLEKGKEYTLTVTLGASGGSIGEFFFLYGTDIGANRYDTFTDTVGTKSYTVVAQTDGPLYFGVQCGTIGLGNSVTVSNISATGTNNRMMLGRPLAAAAVPEDSLPEEDDSPDMTAAEAGSEAADGAAPAEGTEAGDGAAAAPGSDGSGEAPAQKGTDTSEGFGGNEPAEEPEDAEDAEESAQTVGSGENSKSTEPGEEESAADPAGKDSGDDADINESGEEAEGAEQPAADPAQEAENVSEGE